MLLVLISSNFLYSKTTGWQKHGLKGKVQYCFDTAYDIVIQDEKYVAGKKEHGGHTKIIFDKNGNYIEIEHWIYHGYTLDAITIPVYKNGELIKEIVTGRDRTEQISKTEYTIISKEEVKFATYNEDNKKIIEGTTFLKNGLSTKSKFHTFFDGNEETKTSYFEYDSNGNLLLIKTFSSTGELIYYNKFEFLKFDRKVNWIEKVLFDSEEAVLHERPAYLIKREIKYFE